MLQPKGIPYNPCKAEFRLRLEYVCYSDAGARIYLCYVDTSTKSSLSLLLLSF